jgi:hypothetical protein
LIAEVARDHPEAERLEIWFLDEARVGQTGRVCRAGSNGGVRPRVVHDLRHEAVYLFGAACPNATPPLLWSCPRSAPPPMQAMLDEMVLRPAATLEAWSILHARSEALQPSGRHPSR